MWGRFLWVRDIMQNSQVSCKVQARLVYLHAYILPHAISYHLLISNPTYLTPSSCNLASAWMIRSCSLIVNITQNMNYAIHRPCSLLRQRSVHRWLQSCIIFYTRLCCAVWRREWWRIYLANKRSSCMQAWVPSSLSLARVWWARPLQWVWWLEIVKQLAASSQAWQQQLNVCICISMFDDSFVNGFVIHSWCWISEIKRWFETVCTVALILDNLVSPSHVVERLPVLKPRKRSNQTVFG